MRFTSDGTTLGTLGGVRPGGAPVGSISVLQVTIPPFAILVDGGSSTGAYECAFTANEIVNLNARPGSNSRIDRIEVQVPTDPPTGGVRVANVIYTAGAPGASPVPPAPTARCSTVGFVTVPTGAGTITWGPADVFAVAAGGVLPILATNYPVTPNDGQVVYDRTADLIAVYNGAGWDQFHPTAALAYTGGTTATLPNPTTNTDTPITTWVTSGQPSHVVGTDLTYASGEVTAARAMKVRWGLTVAFPTSSAAYRCDIFVQLNGVTQDCGYATYNAVNGGGSQTLTTGFDTSLAAGGKLKFGVRVSTAGVAGIAPRGFAVHRIG
jgi:hypothetical protein